ncbi:MAG: DUF4834 family protein [Marinifilaceae bacterium]
MAFIKFLIVVFGVYYLLKLIIRALFPFLVQKTFDKMQNQAQQQYDQGNRDSSHEGDVTIQNDGNRKETPNKKDFGEYVDYEEVD